MQLRELFEQRLVHGKEGTPDIEGMINEGRNCR